LRKNSKTLKRFLNLQVLSANAETFAQVECLFQDLDFRAKCTRQELEEIFQAFEPAFLAPIKAAMQMAQLPMEKLERILLMGASTRVPRVQELLGHFFAGFVNLELDKEEDQFLIKRLNEWSTN
jgi:molecular chaperone DnaK (HSP70)